MTLSRLLQVALAAELAAGAALALWLLPAPWSHWLALPAAAAVPVVGTALALGLELAIGAWVDPRSPRLGPRRMLALWLGETSSSVTMFCWRQPFAAGYPEPARMHDPQRPAVLLVHGYVCNRAVWRPLIDRGAGADWQIATVNLEPVFADIDRYADVLAGAIERLRADTGAAQVVLIGHSLGGLAARCYLRRHGTRAVSRVITIGSPHQGTVFARLGLGINARQMERGSAFLHRLADSESAAVRSMFVCIASADDNLVVPRSSPLLPGAEHHVVEEVGHLAMVEDPRVWAALRSAIAASRGPTIDTRAVASTSG
jgi:pimeloyl-ACP methyl ester carboxylesterase